MNTISVQELAARFHIQPKSLRKKLRDNGIQKPGKRWEWPEGHEDLATIESLCSGTESATVASEPAAPALPQNIKVGSWEVIIAEEGVRAVYQTAKTKDATRWMNSPEEIRPSLPKAVKEEVLKALSNR